MFNWMQRLARILIVCATLLFLVFAFVLTWMVFGFHKVSRLHEPELAFWMEHQWATAEHDSYLDLAQQVDSFPPTSLYFHVGPLSGNGQLASDLQLDAKNFDLLSSTNYAWVGQVRSKIDLDNPDVRAGVLASSNWLMEQGFDGIHLNIEPIRPDDEAFPLLVHELRSALPDAKISIAMDEWQPDALTQWFAKKLDVEIVSYWSSQQVLALRPFVDEFVVMTYDTRFKDPSLYSWWVEQQSIALSRLMDAETRLLIGLPVYEEGLGFDPEAENIESGLVGYTRGLSNLRSKQDHLQGIALYPFWEMDEWEWITLNNYLDHEIDLP